jgi:hypothetical protein
MVSTTHTFGSSQSCVPPFLFVVPAVAGRGGINPVRCEVAMERPTTQIPSTVNGLKRALELWPYVFIAISIVGLSYLALSAAR